MKKRLKEIENIMEEHEDELLYFRENLTLLENYLKENPFKGSICIFCCWVLNYIEAFHLNVPVPDFILVDSSPYIRPLAELQDEYENFVVVAVDNNMAKIYLVTSAKVTSEEDIKGHIKNHVKKGGWSQQRYERRRDKELLEYSNEIIDTLLEMDKKEHFRRIILVGGKEAIIEIKNRLPDSLRKKLSGEKNLDLKKDERIINREIFELFFIEERKSEKALWERIKGEFMKGGLGAIGPIWVLDEAKEGNIEKLIVNKHGKIDGVRCRNCDYLSAEKCDFCLGCESKSLFKVDLINELVEICAQTNGEVDFVEDIPVLSKIGHMAALLRYKSWDI
jgi:peptide chain release factor subunit 1